MPKNVHQAYRALARGLLARDQWFSHLDPAVLDQWVDEGQLVQYESGEMLCSRGQAICALSVVVQGLLDVSHVGASGKRHVWSYLGPGQVMNLVPVMDDQPAIHDATARGSTIVLQIPKARFEDAVLQNPRLMRSLVRLLCLRSRALYAYAADSALLPLRARCARTLLSLMTAHGRPRGDGVAISLKVSQDELADMLGCTRQSINRELKQLEREGLIAMSYSHFTVLDQAALAALVRN